jgi:hypothetical protein
MVPKSTATDTKWIMAAINPVNSHGGLIDRALIIKISFLVCALCANGNDGASDVRKRYQTPFLATVERVAPHGTRAERKNLQPSLRGRDGEMV